MSVVQLVNREAKAKDEFANRNHDNMLAWRDAILAYALFYPAVEFLSFATIALIFWDGGNRILHGAFTIGVLIEFTMYAQRFFRPIQDLSEKFNILQSAMADCRMRSEEHTSELQSRLHLVCRLLLEKKKKEHHMLDLHLV